MALQTIVVLDETNKIPIGELPVDTTILLISNPPQGCKKVVNIYYDPQLAKYTIEREE